MKKTNIVLLITLGVIATIGKILFMNDYIFIVKWCLTLLTIGVIFYPLTLIIFKNFHDGGWIFSKVLGIAISSLIVWLLSYMKILKYTNVNCYIIIGILLIINLIIAKKKTIKIDNEKIKNILISEIIFIIIFMCWTYIRGMSPQIDSYTEKYMDYGYMNATMNSEYMPAEDIWYSGEHINYYYYGQYVSGFITKIANLQVNEGYNLMIAFIATLTFVLPYMIGYNLTKNFVKDESNKNVKMIIVLIAIISGLSVSIGGSLHYPIYRWISNTKETYYYPDATRYIGYKPETNDKTITEMPSYSSILGDLHAQYIDLIFVLTVLAILLNIMLDDEKKSTKKKILNVNILLLGVILGIQKMTNYWDLPIYFVVISCILIIKNLIQNGFNKKNILTIILQILEIIIIEELVSLPFSKDLYISATKVYFTDRYSPLYKYAVLWGLPILVSVIFIVKLVYDFLKQKDKTERWFKGLIKYIKQMNRADIYVMILSICSIGLIILPEIVYLKDIYGADYQRTNTMFKLTYQAYVMFSICISYIIVRLLYKAKKIIYRIFLVLVLLIQISTIPYGIDAIITKYKNENYKGINNSELYISENLPDDYRAIQWIKQNIDRKSIILEKSGDSFSRVNRVSVFTANPTVLGWYAHEWLWRADENYQAPEDEKNRWQDIYVLYTTNDENKAKEIINKYNISYIYIGNVEMEDYAGKINLDLLLNLGETVFEIGQEECIKTPVYIIKVD